MMRKQLIVAVLLIIAAFTLFNIQPSSPKSQFENWKQLFAIRYSSEYENIYREKIFHQILQKIILHNSNSLKTFEMGINQFSATTTQQFFDQYLANIAHKQQHIMMIDTVRGVQVNWQNKGAVTLVKSQGNCGAVWAFWPIAGIEGLYKLSTGQLIAFSQQQLIDCAEGSQGCNGGFMNIAFKFVKDHGVVPEVQYPYVGAKHSCKNTTGIFKVSGFTTLNGCDNLANALVGRPIQVAVDAANWSPYRSGIFNNCKASLNHGVLLTGMTDQYWRLKNSWGTAWGEKGYIRIARGNTCGICNSAAYPNK